MGEQGSIHRKDPRRASMKISARDRLRGTFVEI
jgi:hypothetical protein